tara:strand:- start:94 stop:234 length:141 start_codon:yes stop_codon:yes gene_type:complete
MENDGEAGDGERTRLETSEGGNIVKNNKENHRLRSNMLLALHLYKH